MANAWNCDFRNADLTGAIFTKADFERCNFQGAIFESVYAWGACFNDANFERVEFGPFNDFTRARCLRTRFVESVMTGQDPRVQNRQIDHIIWDGADLSWAYLSKMDLTELTLWYAKMHNTDFSDSDLNGRDMSQWDIEGARFERCNMQGVNLSGIVVEFLTMDYADLRGANFSNATVHSRIDASGVNAEGVNFSGTYFNKQSEFDGANMRFTNFNGANIRGCFAKAVDFSNSTFIETGMRDGNFRGSNFENCVIIDSMLQGALFQTANFLGATVQGSNVPGGINKRPYWNLTYLAGATFVNMDICGAYTWEEAIFEDLITDENGNQSMERFVGINVRGPDCYLYTAHREIMPDVSYLQRLP